MKALKITVLSIAISFLLISCSIDASEPKRTGILINGEVLASIRQELYDKENSLLAEDGDVFWSRSGVLWHSSHTCSYLANTKTVYHGTVDEARLEGKERACSRCFSESEEDIYGQLSQNPIMSGDVFFTRDGEKWHVSEDCTAIEDGIDIYHGNKALALALGKTEPCEECANNE